MMNFGHLLSYASALDKYFHFAHFKSSGPNYYADHLLYQRLYEDSQKLFDSVGEKSVGVFGQDSIDATEDAQLTAKLIGKWRGERADKNLAVIGLEAVQETLKFAADLLTELGKSGELTGGVSDMVEGIENKLEEFAYLLGQRTLTEKVSSLKDIRRSIKASTSNPIVALIEFIKSLPSEDLTLIMKVARADEETEKTLLNPQLFGKDLGCRSLGNFFNHAMHIAGWLSDLAVQVECGETLSPKSQRIYDRMMSSGFDSVSVCRGLFNVMGTGAQNYKDMLALMAPFGVKRVEIHVPVSGDLTYQKPEYYSVEDTGPKTASVRPEMLTDEELDLLDQNDFDTWLKVLPEPSAEVMGLWSESIKGDADHKIEGQAFRLYRDQNKREFHLLSPSWSVLGDVLDHYASTPLQSEAKDMDLPEDYIIKELERMKRKEQERPRIYIEAPGYEEIEPKQRDSKIDFEIRAGLQSNPTTKLPDLRHLSDEQLEDVTKDWTKHDWDVYLDQLLEGTHMFVAEEPEQLTGDKGERWVDYYTNPPQIEKSLEKLNSIRTQLTKLAGSFQGMTYDEIDDLDVGDRMEVLNDMSEREYEKYQAHREKKKQKKEHADRLKLNSIQTSLTKTALNEEHELMAQAFEAAQDDYRAFDYAQLQERFVLADKRGDDLYPKLIDLKGRMLNYVRLNMREGLNVEGFYLKGVMSQVVQISKMTDAIKTYQHQRELKKGLRDTPDAPTNLAPITIRKKDKIKLIDPREFKEEPVMSSKHLSSRVKTAASRGEYEVIDDKLLTALKMYDELVEHIKTRSFKIADKLALLLETELANLQYETRELLKEDEGFENAWLNDAFREEEGLKLQLMEKKLKGVKAYRIDRLEGLGSNTVSNKPNKPLMVVKKREPVEASVLARLTKLACRLDSIGLKSEADRIDDMIAALTKRVGLNVEALVDTANYLDQNGLTEAANIIDKMITAAGKSKPKFWEKLKGKDKPKGPKAPKNWVADEKAKLKKKDSELTAKELSEKIEEAWEKLLLPAKMKAMKPAKKD
jgi:DNA-binding ferritin-like protein